MGICKCKRRTDLYCFVHNKPVCDTCIVDHGLCHVRTYPEWLSSSEYPPPSCSKCKQSLIEGEPVVRLKCLELFHPKCLEEYLKGWGVDRIATAGCPSCSATVVPQPNDTSSLANDIRSKLDSLLSVGPVARSSPAESTSPAPTVTAHTFSTPNATSKSTRMREPVNTSSSLPATPATVVSMPMTEAPHVKTARKPAPKTSRLEMPNDADDDKYGRKNIIDYIGLRTLLKRINLMQQSPGFTRRLTIGIGFVIALLFIYLIVSSLSGEEETANVFDNNKKDKTA